MLNVCIYQTLTLKHLSITQSKLMTRGIVSKIKYRILNPEVFGLSVLCLHVPVMYLISSDILHSDTLGAEKVEAGLEIQFHIICICFRFNLSDGYFDSESYFSLQI